MDTEIKKVKFQRERLDYLQRKLVFTLKVLGLLQNQISRNEDGSVTPVLTNDDLSQILEDVKALTQDGEVSGR